MSVKDIPQDFRVALLKDAPNPMGALRSKGSGEPPLCMASNVTSALRAAINAALVEQVGYQGAPGHMRAVFLIVVLQLLSLADRTSSKSPPCATQNKAPNFAPINWPLTPEAIQKLCQVNPSAFNI
jgi:hypothetical protein